MPAAAAAAVVAAANTNAGGSEIRPVTSDDSLSTVMTKACVSTYVVYTDKGLGSRIMKSQPRCRKTKKQQSVFRSPNYLPIVYRNVVSDSKSYVIKSNEKEKLSFLLRMNKVNTCQITLNDVFNWHLQ